VAVVIIQKYTRKWMARHVYLKLLSATTSMQSFYRQFVCKKRSPTATARG
jgi:hypothetical protein